MKKFSSLKILYIDDDDSVRKSAIDLLEFYFDTIYQAHDGVSGIEMYKEHKPDIIITDIHMPNLNGLDMVRQIRTEDTETKIIVMTAFLKTPYLLEAMDLGLIKYLVKPVMENELLITLKSCVTDVNEKKNVFNLGSGYKFDTLNNNLFLNNEQVFLSKKEHVFLKKLLINHDRVVTYNELSTSVWDGIMSEDAIRSIVKDIRKKVTKQVIKNVSGIGYKIVLEDD